MKRHYTLNEIIELTGKSRSTINRTIKEMGIEPDGMFKKAYIYNPETAKKIIKSVCLDFDFSLFDTDTDLNNDSQNDFKTNPEASQKESTTYSDNINNGSEVNQISSDYIQFLKEQLRSKDKEIEQLHKLLDQSQQLQLLAQAQVKELQAGNQDEVEENQEQTEKAPQAIVGADKRVSFWKRLFRK